MRSNRPGSRAGSSSARSIIFICLMLIAGFGLFRMDAGAGKSDATGPTFTHSDGEVLSSAIARPKMTPDYGRLPLIFERNEGQTDSQVKFLAKGRGYGLFLTSSEAVLELQAGAGRPNSVVRMKLAGGNQTATVNGTDKLPGKSNYLLGNDPSKWQRNVPQYARVRYSDVYPGINLVYYGVQGRMEFDFEVAPGVDARQIALRFSGSKKLKVTRDGSLILASGDRDLRFQAPKIYQQVGSERRPVAGKFAMRGNYEVGFDLGTYDRARALVIDPVLSYSTYLGGNGAESCSAILGTSIPPGPGTPGCPAIAVDSASRVYIAGSTTSTVFPNPTASPTLHGTANVFIAQLDSSGAALLFSTYLGGSGKDVPAGVAIDSGFNVYVAGTTTSSDFPTSSSAFQTSALNAGSHVFVSKLNSTASAVLYSTYLSGSGTDTATGLAIDPSGRAYVTGTTTSPAFPASGGFPVTTGAFQTAPKATNQFFLSRLDSAQTGSASLLYSTYIGGSTPANGVTVGGGIAVDTNSSAFITGGTNFTDMPVLNASQGTNNGGVDAFVGEFLFPSNTPPTQNYLTYLGGTGDEAGYAIAVDSGFSAYVTGSTTSSTITIPTGTTPFQAASGGGMDAFVAKFGNLTLTTTTPTGTVPFSYFSFLGGSGSDVGLGIAVDTIGGTRVTGWTNSGNFPTLNSPSGLGAGGGVDAFAARIETTATSATTAGNYSTYLGGGGSDVGTSIAVDSTGASYIAGETVSGNFPVVTPFQGSLNGASDAFVTKLGPLVNLSMTATASPSPVGVGNQVTFTYTIINHGDFVSGVTFTDLLPSSTTAAYVSATASPGACGQTAGTVTCTLGALNTAASSTTTSATVTVVLTAAAPTQTTQGTIPSQPPPLGNSARLTVPGSNFQTSASAASVTVNDFGVTVSPATITVPAGVPAAYTVTVTPTGAGFPESVSLACSGLPTSATCNFTNNPIPNLSSGAQSRALVINTTARVSTTAGLIHGKPPFYVTWLPVSGLALLGAGFGGKTKSSKRRLSRIVFLLGFFVALMIFQAGCGSSHKSTTTTTGTPAGSYTITVAATSGTATRNAVLQLIVQ